MASGSARLAKTISMGLFKEMRQGTAVGTKTAAYLMAPYQQIASRRAYRAEITTMRATW